MLTLTENAQKAVARFIAAAESPQAGLRIQVASGGCSGLQYGMALEQTARADDQVLLIGSIQVFVDPVSAPLLDGVTLDFQDSLDGSGFRFHNPNAKASCGCGNSFTA